VLCSLRPDLLGTEQVSTNVDGCSVLKPALGAAGTAGWQKPEAMAGSQPCHLFNKTNGKEWKKMAEIVGLGI